MKVSLCIVLLVNLEMRLRFLEIFTLKTQGKAWTIGGLLTGVALITNKLAQSYCTS